MVYIKDQLKQRVKTTPRQSSPQLNIRESVTISSDTMTKNCRLQTWLQLDSGRSSILPPPSHFNPRLQLQDRLPLLLLHKSIQLGPHVAPLCPWFLPTPFPNNLVGQVLVTLKSSPALKDHVAPDAANLLRRSLT